MGTCKYDFYFVYMQLLLECHSEKCKLYPIISTESVILSVNFKQVIRRVWRYQGIIRMRKSKKYRQHTVQMKKSNRTNNNLQNITQKTKDRVTRTPLRIGRELRCSERESSSSSTSGTRRVSQAVLSNWFTDQFTSTLKTPWKQINLNEDKSHLMSDFSNYSINEHHNLEECLYCSCFIYKKTFYINKVRTCLILYVVVSYKWSV